MIKKYLFITIISSALAALLIVSDIRGLLPLGLIWMGVASLVILILSFWKTREMFWIFVSLFPLESILVVSLGGVATLRPFQVVGGLLLAAVIVKAGLKKNNFELLRFRGMFLGLKKFLQKLWGMLKKADNKPKDEYDQLEEEREKDVEQKRHFGFLDFLIFISPVFAFLAVVNAADKFLVAKQAIVYTSFVFLYWLLRNFLQTKKEKMEAIWFLISGSFPILIYGLVQAVAFQQGWFDLQVFDGRINSTFAEPDWLGIYLVALAALVFWLKFLVWHSKNETMVCSWSFRKVANRVLDVYLFLILLSLILTVARSAWLGAAAVALAYFYILFVLQWSRKGKFSLKKVFKHPLKIIFGEISYFLIITVLAVVIVLVFNLSSFHLENRAGSSFSGMQKITVSCEPETEVPEQIGNIDELGNYGCRHINLEEIETEKQAGREVREVFRPDPNIEIRKDVYGKTWNSIKENWVLGKGIGSSALILGLDENGQGLNASNIFLEAWLSSGIFGLVIFVLFLFLPFFGALVKSFKAIFSRKDKVDWSRTSLIILLFAAIVIPNLFNAGWLLGFFWLILAFFLDK